MRVPGGLAIVCVACLAVVQAEVRADTRWTRVDTTNLIVIGGIGEGRQRVIAAEFEGFRDALTRLLSSNVTATAVPTVVVMFPDEKAFKPFKPVYQGKAVGVGGLFVPRRDVNYILLGPDTTPDALRPVFHEYSHLIVNNVAPDLPVWLNEGLAEYYSSFELGNDGRAVTFGRPLDEHLRELATSQWMPLKDLLATTRDAPQYNEGSRRGVFYAEAWLLVHMLLHGQPDRRQAAGGYLRDLGAGVAPADAWQTHFGNDDIYKALRQYSGRLIMGARKYQLSDRIARASAAAVPLTPHDLESTLGEAMSALRRPEAAVERFDRALALHTGDRRAEAGKAHATNATPRAAASADAPADWFGDYMFAATLLEHADTIDAPSLEAARAALARVVVAKPELPNAYVLLATADEQTGKDPAGALAALTRAHVAVPARDDYTLKLAHARAQGGDYSGARSLLGGILAHPRLPGARELAVKLMEAIVQAEQLAARQPPDGSPAEAAASEAPRAAPEQPVYRQLGAGEQRVEARLQRVDCSAKRIDFVVAVGDRVARFHAGKMDQVEFISYRTDLQGSLACGARTPPDPVYVTFRAGEPDGVAVAIEFLRR